MISADPTTPISSAPQLDRVERWNVYYRLQDLAIPCTCRQGQPLQVQIPTATAAIQFWSVIQNFTAPRQVAVDRLEHCWQQEVAQR